MKIKSFLKKFCPVPVKTAYRIEKETIGEMQKLKKELQNEISSLKEELHLLHNEIISHSGELAWQHNALKVAMYNSNSIFSYCNNAAIEKNKKNLETVSYAYYRRVHELLRVYSVPDSDTHFARIGGSDGGDGGYIMVSPFSSKKIAYSFGISNDVSWDKAMAELGYDIFMYDHTINGLPEENPKFHWKKVGITGGSETIDLKTLDSLLNENGHSDATGMILKMDVEGCEWSVFQNIDENVLKRFDQIVLELHDLQKVQNAELYISALEKLTSSHVAIHIHGNNYRSVCFCNDLITPNILEITLVRKGLFSVNNSTEMVNNALDIPNNPDACDILLEGGW